MKRCIRTAGRFVILALGLNLFGGSLALAAVEPCEFGADVPKTRPNPKAGPTEVRVGIFVFDLAEIDIKASEFRLDFLVEFSWQDGRLGELVRKTGKQSCQLPIETIWHPNLFPVNARAVNDNLPRIVYVHPDGIIRAKRRISGKFAARFNLVDFPADKQTLHVTYISLVHGPDEIRFAWEGGGQADHFTQTGWQVKQGRGSTGVYTLEIRQEQGEDKQGVRPIEGASDSERSLARLDYAIEVTRSLKYYIWKVFVPLALIVIASWSVFWIDPSQMGVQIGIGTSMMLTVVAFLFSLENILPEISYLTRLDIFVYSSLLLVFLVFLEALTTCTLVRQGKEALARRLDWWSRRLFPLMYAIVILRLWWP